MNCSEFEEKSILYLYGELSSKDAQVFEQHLNGCPCCKEKIEVLKETVNFFRKKSMDSPGNQCMESILEKSHIRKVSFKQKVLFPFLNYRSPIFAFSSILIMVTVIFLFSYKKSPIFLKEEMSWQLTSDIEETMEDISNRLDVLEWEMGSYSVSFLNKEMEDIKIEMDELFTEIDKV